MGFIAALLILLITFMIPIVSILSKSSIGKAIARRIDGQTEHSEFSNFNSQNQSAVKVLEAKMETLEKQVETLTSELSSLKNEYQFLETLLETDNRNKNQLSD